MPDTTVNYGYRIPKADGTDLIVPDDIRVPITSIDTQMKTNANTASSANTVLTNRVTALETNAPTTVSGASAIAIATGFTLTTAVLERRTKVCQLYFSVKRTGATVQGDSLGNLTNVNIGTVAAGYRPSIATAWTPADMTIPCFGIIDSGGVITACITAPNIDLTTNNEVRGVAMWFTD